MSVTTPRAEGRDLAPAEGSGWVMFAGTMLAVVGTMNVRNRTSWGRWVGVATATANCILQLLWLPAFPFLALTLFTLDILVIYGLIAYGGRRPAL